MVSVVIGKSAAKVSELAGNVRSGAWLFCRIEYSKCYCRLDRVGVDANKDTSLSEESKRR